MIIRRSFQIYSFFFICLALTACTNTKRIDVSDIKLDVKVERFDKDLQSLTSANVSDLAPQLQKKYTYFYSDFMEGMLGVGSTTDTAYYKNLRTVLNNNDFKELEKAVESKYPNLKQTENQLIDAFKHVKYYYPKQKIPRIISFFSGFSVQTPIGNDYVGIGLDMFLGADSKFYPALRQSIPYYISQRFTTENITPRVMESFIREDMFTEKDQDRSLLAKMIYNGKILYFMDAVMPDSPDSLKIGYTAKQLEWCKTYEADIWGYFLEQDLLYETDYMKIQKYLTDAPFTPGIGENNESAPKLGEYIGWQIVKKYMDKNPGITVQKLMEQNDPQNILNESKYKPK
ncbi:gliding motility lipoprotein GldB [Rubrolithibacter danxiaensis]|uniref:gliding motility lipoprotein GldB n=1 Tax=Rubrolithibacter danxiaensis TaxID=3390805 RepID=UPI003BF8C4AD